MPRSKTARAIPQARILIVDDHPAIREALSLRIARESDLMVCGEAVDLADALEVAAATNPDVAVIDVALKTASGIDLIARLKARHETIRMLVWSMYSEEFYAERALRAGARGYITKEQPTEEIIEAIRQVLDGKVYLSPAMAEKLLGRFVGPGTRASDRLTVNSLSDRELDVFRFIGQGFKTAEIAAKLHLSVSTVETYRDRIRAKLDLSDGAKLAYRAMQWVHENQ
jgi:DNA-binding NarL/FixJ family response regulator